MVSGVSFRAGCMDSARDMLNQPQANSRPQAAAQAPEMSAPKKKSNKFLKAVAGIAVAAAVVAGSLVAAKHFKGFDKIIEKMGADATGIKGYVKTAAEWGNKGGQAIIDFGKTAWKAASGLFKKGEAGAEAVA